MGFREKIREKKEKKLKLDEIDKKISEKKSELESLKTEIMELKNFIDQKFESGEFKSDYNVDITDCYIIGLHGKKYITRRVYMSLTAKSCCLHLPPPVLFFFAILFSVPYSLIPDTS